MRESYTFGGWYKETECINEWDFDSNTLPEEKFEFDEDGRKQIAYQETKLYAKWLYKGKRLRQKTKRRISRPDNFLAFLKT